MTRALQIQKIPGVKLGADPHHVERALRDVKIAIEDRDAEDVVIETPRRLLLRSPNGTYWSIGVTNAGVLTATNVGTSL